MGMSPVCGPAAMGWGELSTACGAPGSCQGLWPLHLCR